MVFGNDEQRERSLILAAVTIILLLSLSALATFRLLAGLAGVPGVPTTLCRGRTTFK